MLLRRKQNSAILGSQSFLYNTWKPFVKFTEGKIFGNTVKELETRHRFMSSQTSTITESNMAEAPEAGIQINTKSFCCLMGLTDQSVLWKVQNLLETDEIYKEELSETECSALAYILMSGPVKKELNLTKFKTKDDWKQRLIPAVKNCREALFYTCTLSDLHFELISSALSSKPSHLRDLDVRKNTLSDTSVFSLCDGLKSPNCQLSLLRLYFCGLSESSCSSLTSALNSNPSHLTELYLSYNEKLCDAGVKHLCDYLQNPNCQLQKLELILCGLTKDSCSYLYKALESNPSSQLTYLNLCDNGLKQSDVKDLLKLEQSPDSRLETLLW